MEEIRTTDNSSYEVEELSANSNSGREEGSTGFGDGSTSAGRSGGTGSNGDDQDNLYFAKNENRKVRNLKFLVILILFLVTTAVCFAVYFVTANGQASEFEARYVSSSLILVGVDSSLTISSPLVALKAPPPRLFPTLKPFWSKKLQPLLPLVSPSPPLPYTKTVPGHLSPWTIFNSDRRLQELFQGLILCSCCLLSRIKIAPSGRNTRSQIRHG